MRSDIAPGAKFPDYELPDHTNVPRKLSDLQGDDPLILTLARGHYCPKEHQQHLELATFYPKDRGSLHRDCDDHDRLTSHAPGIPGVGRCPVDLSLRSGAHRPEGPRHPGIHGPRQRPDDSAHARAQARPRHPLHLRRLLVLGTALGRRPLARPVRCQSRDPPRLLSTPGLREAWDAGDYSSFHGWNKRTAPRPTAR